MYTPSLRGATAFCLVLFCAISIFAQQNFSLLKDLNDNPSGAAARFFVDGPNGAAYFFGLAADESPALWRTDGTTNNTFLVKKISGAAIASPDFGCSKPFFSQGKLLFWQLDGRQLWASDGTENGTQLIFEPIAADLSGAMKFLQKTSAATFFANKTAIFKTDGSAFGTQKIYTNSDEINDLCVGNDSIYFISGNLAGAQRLFRADKNGENLLDLGQMPTGDLWHLSSIDGRIFWWRAGYEIRRFGMANIQNFSLIKFNAVPKNAPNLVVIGSNVYFLGRKNSNSTSLWKADANTISEVQNFPQTKGYGNLTHFSIQKAGNRVVILTSRLDNLTPKMELWSSDGTVGDAILVKSFDGFFAENLTFPHLASDGNQVILHAHSASFALSSEIWKSNGTTAGTVKIADVPTHFPFKNGFSSMEMLKNHAFFSIDNGENADESDPFVVDLNQILPTPNCQIGAKMSSFLCQNNGTPNLATDDSWEILYRIEGTNTGNAGWTNTDGSATGGYFEQKKAIISSAGNVQIAVRDVEKPTCATAILAIDLPSGGCSSTTNSGDLQIQDLRLTTSNFGKNGVFSGSFDVFWHGSGQLSNVPVALFLSPDPLFSASDLAVKDAYFFFNFENGQFVNDRNFEVELPANLPEGDYFLLAVVDNFWSNFLVAETDETNNVANFPIKIGKSAAPATCSIDAVAAASICDNHGTSTDASDDTWTAKISVKNNGICGQKWTATYFLNNNLVTATGNFGENLNLGAFSMSAIPQINLTIKNDAQPSILQNLTIFRPNSCATTGNNSSTDLQISTISTNLNPAQWSNFSISFSVKNLGSTNFSNISIDVPMPAGVVFEGGNPANFSAGNFDENTQIWTISSLASGATAMLHLHFFNTTSGQKLIAASLISSQPTDTNLANNLASVKINGGGGNVNCAANRLENGSFEQDLNKWDGSGGEISTIALLGSKAVRLCQNDQIRQILPAKSGDNLTLVFNIRGANLATNVLASIKYLRADFSIADFEFGFFSSNAGQYSEATISKIAPSDAVFVEIGFISQTANCVLLDEICLSETGNNATNADLELTMTADKTDVPQWTPVTYRLAVKNVGTTPISSAFIRVEPCANNGGRDFSVANGFVYASVPNAPTLGNYDYLSQFWSISSLAPGQTAMLSLPMFNTFPYENRLVAFVQKQIPADIDSQPSDFAPANCAPTEDDEAIFGINLNQFGQQISPLSSAPNATQLLDFQLVPNPTDAFCSLYLTQFLKKNVAISVVNSLGKTVSKTPVFEVKNPIFDLDLTDESNGVYFIKIDAEGFRAIVKRLIINKL